jgi:hypothetical protein
LNKGCFLKFIIIFTIVLASILYLVENKFDELFLEPGKEFLLSAIDKNWDDELKFIVESEEKDSLKMLLNYFVSGIKSSEKFADSSAKEIINYLELTFSDSLIDDEELSNITKLIKDAMKNEE